MRENINIVVAVKYDEDFLQYNETTFNDFFTTRLSYNKVIKKQFEFINSFAIFLKSQRIIGKIEYYLCFFSSSNNIVCSILCEIDQNKPPPNWVKENQTQK